MELLKQDIYPYYKCMKYYERKDLCLALVEPNGIISTFELRFWFASAIGEHFFTYLDERDFHFSGIYFFHSVSSNFEQRVKYIERLIRECGDNYTTNVVAFRDCHTCGRIAVMDEILSECNYVSLKGLNCSFCSHL